MIEVIGLRVPVGRVELGPLDFTVARSAYAVLIGPSGAGKTTLLETLAGLRRPAAGRVLLDGVDVTETPPGRRAVGYVPQDAVLFPTMSVRDNLIFGIRRRLKSSRERARAAAGLADRLGVGDLLDRFPAGLSGGERQRVALGRALAIEPRVLLLDEPLSALEATSRAAMRSLLEEVRRTTACTVLHVSHDAEDAATLGETVLNFAEGRIVSAPPHGRDAGPSDG